MKTIFNTYIEVESQEQADRLKQVCIDNGLPIWDDEMAFRFDGIEVSPTFECFDLDFAIYNSYEIIDKIKATEPEWMELLTKYKEEQCKKTID